MTNPPSMPKRALQVLISLLLTIDILMQVLVKAPCWVFFARARPSSRETISATLGWGAANGYRWCVVLSGLVDDVFGKGHCANAALREAADEFPL